MLSKAVVIASAVVAAVSPLGSPRPPRIPGQALAHLAAVVSSGPVGPGSGSPVDMGSPPRSERHVVGDPLRPPPWASSQGARGGPGGGGLALVVGYSRSATRIMPLLKKSFASRFQGIILAFRRAVEKADWNCQQIPVVTYLPVKSWFWNSLLQR